MSPDKSSRFLVKKNTHKKGKQLNYKGGSNVDIVTELHHAPYVKHLVSMEEEPESCNGRASFSIKNSKHITRGDAIIRDHQVNTGTNLFALVGFATGKIRVVEKPALSEAYTVLLFSFSSSGITTANIKLIATSRLTENRLKSYPSKVKIVSDGKMKVNGANVVSVKRLVLFKKELSFDFKHDNSNVLVPQGEECHIKYIVVDQTGNSNIVIFATETMATPCYLADENNQCDCRYIVAQLSGIRVEPGRELSQKLQLDCTASAVPMEQCEQKLHVCIFCGKALIKPKECAQLCDDRIIKQIKKNRPKSKTISKKKVRQSKKKKKTCGCCPNKRKEKDQSDAYVMKRADDYSSVGYETQIGRRSGSKPYTDYNRFSPQCEPYPQNTPQPDFKYHSEFKPRSEFKHFPMLSPEHDPEFKPLPYNNQCCVECRQCCRSCNKYKREEILTQECSAANKGFIASTEYCLSDTQIRLPIENTDIYLICQAYTLRSEKQSLDKQNRKRLNEKPDTTHEQYKKYRLEPQRDYIHCCRAEARTKHIYAADKFSEDSANSTIKENSTEEVVKEISIQSTESYLVAQSLNAPKSNNNNLLIGRTEGSNFQAYPFRKRSNFMNRRYGTIESHYTCSKFPSLTSISSSGSYLSVGRRRQKRSSFSKTLGLFKSLPTPKTNDRQLMQ